MKLDTQGEHWNRANLFMTIHKVFLFSKKIVSSCTCELAHIVHIASTKTWKEMEVVNEQYPRQKYTCQTVHRTVSSNVDQ